MHHQELKARIRQEALEEASQDDEHEARIERRLRRWRRATIVVGITFMAGIAAVIPFLAGHSLHDQRESVGKKVLQMTMGLFLLFTYVAGTCFTFWKYLRDINEDSQKICATQQ